MTVLLRKTRRLNPLLLQGQSHFASQNKEDYMAKNSKKIIALTAAAGAVGAVAATLASCFTKYKKIKMLINPPMKSRLIMKMMTLILSTLNL